MCNCKSEKLIVNVVKNTSNKLPEYETEGSAGMDLTANLSEPITLKPLERQLIPTGLFMEIPVGYEGQVRARSGLAIKHGICLINGVGTIDSDYRGELKVPMVNLGEKDFTISNGERIAQIVFTRHEHVQFKLVEALEETERGEGGFGHTGK